MINANATISLIIPAVSFETTYVVNYYVHAESTAIGGGALFFSGHVSPGYSAPGVPLLFTDTPDIIRTKIINHAVESALLFNPPVTITNLDSIVIWGLPGVSGTGPQGLQGDQGEPGPPGPQGPEGNLGNVTIAVTCDCKKDD